MKTFLLLTLVAALATVLRADSSSALAHAKAAFQKGDLAVAETLLAPLASGEKPDAAACHELGLVRQRQGRGADAVSLLEKATTLDARRPEYFSALGIALSERIRKVSFSQQAMLAVKLKKAFANSVELDPRHLPGLIGLARFFASAPEIAGGSFEKAREYAGRVQQLNPFAGAMELGNVAERAEDFATALAKFDAAAKLQPQNAGAHAAAGRMLAKLGRTEEARDRLETALELDPARETTKLALAELGPRTP